MTDNDFNPVVEIQAEVQVTPTLELQAEVDMGSLASERNAEAWAVGQRGGVDVSSTDQTYHNNAKYWAEQAEQTVVGSIIDDTSTALNKTWSAHKISEEFAETNEEVTDLKSAKAPIITESISTPADVQTFSDGADGIPVKTLTVEIAPVQDLHGQSNPYPAGGGKNLANISGTKTITSQTVVGSVTLNAGTYSFSCKIKDNSNITGSIKINAEATNLKTSYFVAGLNGIAKAENVTIGTDDTSVNFIIAGSVAGYNYTASEFQCEIGTTATDYAPYENICPITGHTGANVSRTGKNLFGGSELKSKLQTITGATTGTDTVGDYVTFAGSSAMSGIPLFDKFKANTQYTVILKYKKNNTNTASNIAFLYSDGTFGYINSQETAAEGALYTAVITSTSEKTITDIRAIYASGGTTVYYNLCGVFEGVLTVDQFAPYTGNTYHITFPEAAGTVYGGTLTIHQDGSGELVVDKALIVFDGSNDENWNFSTSDSKNRVYTTLLASTIDNTGDVYANYLKAYQNAIYPDEWNYQKATASFIIGVPSGINSKNAWETYLASNNLQICYKLATPTVIPLSNQQVIQLLKGENNIWADTGKINAVDYPADTKLYIDKKLTELQALVLEN